MNGEDRHNLLRVRRRRGSAPRAAMSWIDRALLRVVLGLSLLLPRIDPADVGRV